jgi:alkyl sulfatase BDS1-like metallo-beta-lactamase superfamily hydrolase
VSNLIGANALEMLSYLTVEQIFDATAIRIDGPRAGSLRLGINWTIGDAGNQYFLRLENGVLSLVSGRHGSSATLNITLPRENLLFLLLGFVTLADLVAGGIASTEGDVTVLDTLRSLLDSFDPTFAIVTP